MVLAAFAVASFCAFCGHVLATETLIIPQGRIRGTVRQSRDSNPYYAFLGIPYALPPVEDLRFKDPVPHPGWSGERDATTDSPVCPQAMPYFPEKGDAIFGQEDCLFLNVYSPNPSSDAKLPVMVFVHGGGFLMGQATSNMYGPEYFMDHNVVLVTIQYRLGVLGFLSFGNAEVPGNLGMKDQVLALQWIQENIEEFGGNPDSVTIFGESAGAASVSYHLVSPLSKGLFHRAILQSGTASCSWASTPAWLARDRAHAFATLVGCPTQPIETVLDCLRQLPTETFVTTLNKFHIWFKNPMITFAPVIESPLSQNNFLPDHPLRLPHADVPIIIGVNNKEGGIVGAVYCTDDFKLTHQLNADFDRLLPLIVSCNWLPKDKRAEFVQKVKSFYLNNQPVGEDNLEGLIDRPARKRVRAINGYPNNEPTANREQDRGQGPVQAPPPNREDWWLSYKMNEDKINQYTTRSGSRARAETPAPTTTQAIAGNISQLLKAEIRLV
ncbi:hypothetical protein M8J75_016521 [Diaphorina citri]|nr:hypothetical protein M8J75_016521 [Diaphorina citri]KAI5696692.1 hypothetical protein M8J75_016521 [Diaphorina citri]